MQVKLHEAKTHLSRLIQRALDGEEVIIAKGDKPLVRLVVLESALRKRTLGSAAGQIRIADDFDAPLGDFDGYR
ncbi:MAG: type II toxin-antitoxin system Phd/YefM family antitoxin [Proteobacteria bacterium]|nr:type II toxin-antitoxin system Phd/YefM family antitoxin [Pseudomonadota bacterium]